MTTTNKPASLEQFCKQVEEDYALSKTISNIFKT